MPPTVHGLITTLSLFHHPYPTDCFHHVPNATTQEKASYQDKKEQLSYWLDNPNPFPASPISCTPFIHQKSSSHYSSFKSKQRLKIPQKGGFILKKPPSSTLYLFPVADSVSVSFQESDSSLKIIGYYIIICVLYWRPAKPSPPPTHCDLGSLRTPPFPVIHTHRFMRITEATFSCSEEVSSLRRNGEETVEIGISRHKVFPGVLRLFLCFISLAIIG